jgi:DNA-binding NarL/FixJ family response regulator
MEPHSPIRIIIVDDHAMTRTGLRFFLAAYTNPPTKLRNSVAIHCISREIKIAVSITDWYQI